MSAAMCLFLCFKSWRSESSHPALRLQRPKNELFLIVPKVKNMSARKQRDSGTHSASSWKRRRLVMFSVMDATLFVFIRHCICSDNNVIHWR